MASDSLDILVPAYNEADRLSATIASLRGTMLGRIIAVDDGSSDGTSEAARQASADVVLLHPLNLGKGAALNSALAHSSAPLLLLVDADLGESAANLTALVDAVQSGQCDMAVAAFPRIGRKSGVGFAQAFARWGIARRTGRNFASPLSGQRCVRREFVDAAGGFAGRFGVEVALTLSVLGQGGRVMEIELPLSHRKTGRTLSGFLHRARQAADIAHVLLTR